MIYETKFHGCHEITCEVSVRVYALINGANLTHVITKTPAIYSSYWNEQILSSCSNKTRNSQLEGVINLVDFIDIPRHSFWSFVASKTTNCNVNMHGAYITRSV